MRYRIYTEDKGRQETLGLGKAENRFTPLHRIIFVMSGPVERRWESVPAAKTDREWVPHTGRGSPGSSAGIDHFPQRNYRYYMKPIELKVARIGNSRGVRLPAGTLERYRIGASVIMEERSDGILLRPQGPASSKLSWEETAREMAAAGEDWSAWDATAADGLDDIPWAPARPRRVAEPGPRYAARRPRRKQ